MFRVTRRVFDPFNPKDESGSESSAMTQPRFDPFHMQEAIGTVINPITPDQEGRIEVKTVSWPARLDTSVKTAIAPANSKVKVRGRHGITLLVCPHEAVTP